TADSAWRLLELFGVRPDNATLERQHVYTFEASYAQQWRRGRILLAGDACHLMPPFAGQGMTSGFRDVMNLAWKLDLVLRDQADAPLLDSYMAERQAHVQHAISMSVNLGRIICQTDHRAAADRDTVMLAAASRPVPAVALRQRSPLQPLKKGLLHHGPTGRPSAPAGVLLPQGRVARDGEIGLFDDIVGLGFVLLCARRPADLIDAGSREFLAELGAHLVHVLPADQILDADQVHTADVATADAGTPAGTAPPGGVHTVVDLDGVYLSLLAETSSAALLVRPDFYAFGGAADRAGLNTLVDDLRGRLRPVSPPAAAAAASELEPPVVAR
ncbi:FAD-dependent monooxygenase, partial [Frankia sp. Mgl5]|uniref:FAD-dependent monooxygenase n=1 Tax=Frankia sp. Mgl5 TaxID=2933793 RepID=UPI00200CB27C